MSRLKELEQFGQSVWLDYLTREAIQTGEIAKLIEQDGLKGMTSNPAIFEKAIAGGREYDDDIKRFVEEGMDVGTIFRKLAVHDIQLAADALRPVFKDSDGRDGFISMEVSPYLADDTAATMAEARSLWQEIARPNLMIKIPATEAGLPAIRDLTAEGLNINITLLFSREVYRRVAEAYIEGLEQMPADSDLSAVASVASFFVSRIDAKVDAAIDKRLEEASKPEKAALAALATLRGKIAVANAKEAYQIYKATFAGPRWEKLAARGAKPQRLLWASTSTKNKAYSDVLYVDTLIGADTVNTMPPETMDAFRDHGSAKASIEDGVEAAREALKTLEDGGVSLDAITEDLVVDGVDKFAEAADKLYAALAVKRLKLLDGNIAKVEETLGAAEDAVKAAIAEWTHWGSVRRLWARDKSLWTNGEEDKWMGWLDIAARERADLNQLTTFREEIDRSQLSDVVLLGMGGSSLGAAVLRESFGQRQGWPRLHVLDSTDPEQIAALEQTIVTRASKFIVSSKSGTTLEPNVLKDYFWDRASSAGAAGAQFMAVTDPGSPLERLAKEQNFAHVFLGDPEIGGRYSVLSKFGLAPGAAMGLDLERFLAETERMVTSCGAMVPPAANPGVRLGIVLGTLATKFGRDKVTIIASDALRTMGAWLEQLIAESTGKRGKGLIPVDGETLGDPDAYGEDRVFVNLRLAGVEQDGELLRGVAERGHPVLSIVAEDCYELGQLFFLWEIAIAVAGAVIGIDPFNQPDVESAKVKARELTDAYEKDGALPEATPIYEEDSIALFADEANAASLGVHDDLAGYLKAHLDRLKPNDYFALLAFIHHCDENEAPLQAMRLKVRDSKKAATCVGFGPRFLHSTGQAYKGGPNSGVFVQISCDHAVDLQIPGRKITFGTVERAQAIGDFAVLNERGRRALRIHLKDVKSGLAALAEAFDLALA